MANPNKLPVNVLYISHGTPKNCELIQEDETGKPSYPEFNRKNGEYLKELGEKLKPKIKALVIFSAHWETDITKIAYRDSEYEKIHDTDPGVHFAMEPEDKYPAHGSTEVAKIVKKRLEENNIPCEFDSDRVLDHSVWEVAYKMYPQADVPVVSVSICPKLTNTYEYHIQVGKALRGLHNEGIFVIGSGGTIHNFKFGLYHEKAPKPLAWAVEVDDWLASKTLDPETRDLVALTKFSEVPNSEKAFETCEHFLPFLVAAGAAVPKSVGKKLLQYYCFGVMSLMSIQYDDVEDDKTI